MNQRTKNQKNCDIKIYYIRLNQNLCHLGDISSVTTIIEIMSAFTCLIEQTPDCCMVHIWLDLRTSCKSVSLGTFLEMKNLNLAAGKRHLIEIIVDCRRDRSLSAVMRNLGCRGMFGSHLVLRRFFCRGDSCCLRRLVCFVLFPIWRELDFFC